ncbi:hypothetical protein Slin15195_G062070 [Septoria linicola]|uniref:Uncharacterized protein n=1 Tax=Septoria linicola TaxID=215465 RepID=A0A9Q9AVJ0_9PEZI|nr:hypothetical protein Slin14017_G077880 [Septoria linicola]USW52888.1 hypothetical protein Slin15195_G062070 [Septoria linicola]
MPVIAPVHDIVPSSLSPVVLQSQTLAGNSTTHGDGPGIRNSKDEAVITFINRGAQTRDVTPAGTSENSIYTPALNGFTAGQIAAILLGTLGTIFLLGLLWFCCVQRRRRLYASSSSSSSSTKSHYLPSSSPSPRPRTSRAQRISSPGLPPAAVPIVADSPPVPPNVPHGPSQARQPFPAGAPPAAGHVTSAVPPPHPNLPIPGVTNDIPILMRSAPAQQRWPPYAPGLMPRVAIDPQPSWQNPATSEPSRNPAVPRKKSKPKMKSAPPLLYTQFERGIDTHRLPVRAHTMPAGTISYQKPDLVVSRPIPGLPGQFYQVDKSGQKKFFTVKKPTKPRQPRSLRHRGGQILFLEPSDSSSSETSSSSSSSDSN